MTEETRRILQQKLPDWAVKPHPTKTYLSVINPMAVIDVLNEAFGEGGWDYKAREIHLVKEDKKWIAASHGTLIVEKEGIHIEQFGGSDNADLGDALKGSATDALTKCASYLGVGASIYKGQGNQDAPLSIEEACATLAKATTLDELKTAFMALPKSVQSDNEVIAKKDELKELLTV